MGTKNKSGNWVTTYRKKFVRFVTSRCIILCLDVKWSAKGFDDWPLKAAQQLSVHSGRGLSHAIKSGHRHRLWHLRHKGYWSQQTGQIVSAALAISARGDSTVPSMNQMMMRNLWRMKSQMKRVGEVEEMRGCPDVRPTSKIELGQSL